MYLSYTAFYESAIGITQVIIQCTRRGKCKINLARSIWHDNDGDDNNDNDSDDDDSDDDGVKL